MMGSKQRFWFFLFLGFVFIAVFRFEPYEKNPTVFSSYSLTGPLTTEEKLLFGFPLDPNRMNAKDWEVLPRIGPKLAERIVRFRKENGDFQNTEMLLQVPGVGEKTLKNLIPFLKVGASIF